MLTPLGQNSLYAFIAHVVAVAVVALALHPFGMTLNSPWWLNAILQIVSVLVIWLFTRRHLLEPTHKTLVWRASPIAIALLVVILLPFLPESTAHARPTAAAATPVISEAILARPRAPWDAGHHLRLTAAGQLAVADHGSAVVADRGSAAATSQRRLPRGLA